MHVTGVTAVVNQCPGIRVLSIAHCTKLERRTYQAVAIALGHILVRHYSKKLVVSLTLLQKGLGHERVVAVNKKELPKGPE